RIHLVIAVRVVAIRWSQFLSWLNGLRRRGIFRTIRAQLSVFWDWIHASAQEAPERGAEPEPEPIPEPAVRPAYLEAGAATILGPDGRPVTGPTVGTPVSLYTPGGQLIPVQSLDALADLGDRMGNALTLAQACAIVEAERKGDPI